MSHVMYVWLVSHMNEALHVWMSHVMYEWIVSYQSSPFQVAYKGHVKWEWVASCRGSSRLLIKDLSHVHVMSHVMSHDSFPCDIPSCHVWINRVAYASSPLQVAHKGHVTCEWVVSCMNASCHIWMRHYMCEWVMSCMDESCHMWMRHFICEWVMSLTHESCHV